MLGTLAKSDAQRGPYGAWAYRTRTLLDLNSEWVADQLGYSRPTLVKVEAGSIPPSRRMRDTLGPFYRRIAAQRGSTIPLEPPSEPPTASQDLAAVLASLKEQTDLLRHVWASIDNLADAIRGDQDKVSVRALREELQALADLGLLVAPQGARAPVDEPDDDPPHDGQLRHPRPSGRTAGTPAADRTAGTSPREHTGRTPRT